ncbi:flagellar filament capping protein FliD [Treponema sp.]
MSDTFIPGVKSRYDTEKLIDGLMKLERIPKERAEKNVESMTTQKSIWQDVGRRMTSLRESARALYSFQNPFNERVAKSDDENVITATATREASEQERSFSIKNAASADRFISRPLAEKYQVEAGEYSFSVGKDEISFPFRGGSLKEFSDILNRRGKEKIRASTIAVETGTRSLVIESLVTGSTNRLVFAKDSEKLAIDTGIAERIDSGERTVSSEELTVSALGKALVPVEPSLRVSGDFSIEIAIKTTVRSSEGRAPEAAPTGPLIPSPGNASYGGISIENDPSTVPLPEWKAPPIPQRVDDLQILTLQFSDGSSAPLNPIRDTDDFTKYLYKLSDYGKGKALSGLAIDNKNTHRDITLNSIRLFDPSSIGNLRPRAPLSVASDAKLSMDGIEITRSSNEIDDLIPGVKLTVRGPSEGSVKLSVEPDRDAAKEAVIALVGNYNRLIAEINVLTRNDEKIIQELSYLKDDEREEMKKKQGALQGDSTLNQFKANLQRSASSPYPTSAEREMALLSQLGISTDARRAGSGQGFDASRMRGYLEIDEKALDAAFRDKLPAVREIFGNDTDGDLIADSGFAYTLDSMTKPYVETAGIISLKTGTLDSRVSQEKRRIETMDKQLLAKEDDLKRQYGMMEGALNRMESTSGSIEQFNKNSSSN